MKKLSLVLLALVLCLGSVGAFATNTATKSLTLTVAPATLQITSSSTLPSGQQGVAYTDTLAASGGVSPYTWSLTSGTLPNGITLSPAGVLSGISTVQGSFTFTLKATDSASGTASVVFTMVMSACPPLTITTASPLPAAQVGVAYNLTLTASGGVAPYNWSIFSGALPAGLTLNSSGIISGTPTASGSVNFTPMVSDSAGN